MAGVTPGVPVLLLALLAAPAALPSVLKRADFVYLLRQSGLSRGNLSLQMTNLNDAGLVEIEKSFVHNRPRTVYSLTTKGRMQASLTSPDLAAAKQAHGVIEPVVVHIEQK